MGKQIDPAPDMKGRPLQEGDKVFIHAVVRSVYGGGPGSNNINLDILDAGATGEVPPSLTLNSRLLETDMAAPDSDN